jgi:hypothetical protein
MEFKQMGRHYCGNKYFQKTILCPTEIWAVAWIQDFLEPVCRDGQDRGRGMPKQGQTHLMEREKIIWNPAEMEET